MNIDDLIEQATALPATERAELLQALFEADPLYGDLGHIDGDEFARSKEGEA